MGFKERFVCGSSDCAGSKDGAMDIYLNVYSAIAHCNYVVGYYNNSGCGDGNADGCGDEDHDGNGSGVGYQSQGGDGYGSGYGCGKGYDSNNGDG